MKEWRLTLRIGKPLVAVNFGTLLMGGNLPDPTITIQIHAGDGTIDQSQTIPLSELERPTPSTP